MLVPGALDWTKNIRTASADIFANVGLEKPRKSKYKSAVKQMESLVKKGDKKKVKEFFPKFQSILMQVAKKGIVNRKTASRKISKISKKIS